MKNFLIGVLGIVALGYLGGLLAWWGVALVAAVIGFGLQMHGGLSFLAGGLGGGIFFGLYARVLDTANSGILSSKMGEVLSFDTFLVTVVIGMVLGAMGMLSGKYLRDVLSGGAQPSKYRNKYR